MVRKHRFSSTKELEDREHRIGHDINTGLGRLDAGKDLRLPREVRVRDHRSPLRVAEYHEAWRYGINLEQTDETDIEEWLQRAIRWLEEMIARETEAS